MFLLVSIAVAGVAVPAGADGVKAPMPLPASPAAFAERAAARGESESEWAASLQGALELIVLAAACAMAVAFYSAATGSRDAQRVPVRIRRR